jgi:pilus assembly protein CpaB
VATLLVSPQDAERLALASSEGRLLLTLRSWTDSLAVNTGGAVAEELVGAPVPPAAAAAQPQPARPAPPAAGRRGRGGRQAATPAAALPGEGPPKKDVVEILRGDRFEERKFSKGDNRP